MFKKVALITLFISLPCLSFGMDVPRNLELIDAASHGDVERVQRLIEEGANVKSRDRHGLTPLHWAVLNWAAGMPAQGRGLEVAALLLQRDAHVNAQDNCDETPLHMAESVAIAELLVQHGARVGAQRKDGVTPLHLAVERQHSGIAALLLHYGAPVDAQNNYYETPLHMAASDRDFDMVELLLQHGAQLYAQEKHGRISLHLAALNLMGRNWENADDMVDMLLEEVQEGAKLK